MSMSNKTIAAFAKAVTLSAFIALRLGTGIAAFAQGLPPGTVPPIYGSQAFHNQPYQTSMVFSKIIDHFRHRQVAAQRSATSGNGN